MNLPTSITSKLDKTPHGCWLWTGSLDQDGYGRVTINGRAGRLVHRVVYELARGTIPAGLVLMHKCERHHPGTTGRRCCRPEHLEPGTVAENAQDRGHKGRAARQREPITPTWMRQR